MSPTFFPVFYPILLSARWKLHPGIWEGNSHLQADRAWAWKDWDTKDFMKRPDLSSPSSLGLITSRFWQEREIDLNLDLMWTALKSFLPPRMKSKWAKQIGNQFIYFPHALYLFWDNCLTLRAKEFSYSCPKNSSDLLKRLRDSSQADWPEEFWRSSVFLGIVYLEILIHTWIHPGHTFLMIGLTCSLCTCPEICPYWCSRFFSIPGAYYAIKDRSNTLVNAITTNFTRGPIH
jgi:hypothetical protein